MSHAKTDLIVSVRVAANVINGKVPNGMNANFASDFRKPRYAIILLVGLEHPFFEEHRIEVDEFTCINFYRLVTNVIIFIPQHAPSFSDGSTTARTT